MTQRMGAIGDNYYIQDDQGARVFKVDGQALCVRDTLIFRDMSGNDLCRTQEHMVRVKDTMEVEAAHGETSAHVKKAMITPLHDHCVVRIGNGPDLDVQGNILTHEFRITDGSTTVAESPNSWASWPGRSSGTTRGSRPGSAGLVASEYSVFGLDEDDLFAVADAIPTGSVALFLLLEHVWAKGLRESVENGQDTVVANGWITPTALMAWAPPPRI
jgi:uncharacterized protein YxjI